MSNILVPQLGESVVEARVARWLKKEGDRVETGEPVVELETEKIDLEVGADHGGVITSIKRQEGEDVKVGELLATVDESAAAVAPPRSPEARAAAPAAAPPAAAPHAAGAPASAAPQNASASGDTDGQRATPTARTMARAHDVNLERVQGSGSAGRVMKQDIQNALSAAPLSAPTGSPVAPASRPGAPAPQGTRTEVRQRMSKRRATIARRLVEAQRTAAMLTTFNELDMSELMALRERRKEEFKKRHGVNLGIASFFVKASVAALKTFPLLNAEIQGDEVVQKNYYDIGMAVGAEGGLVVPVLRDADRMSFAEIELAIRDYATRAAEGTLTLEDLMGGTFTITNGGVFGSLMSTPILNPPQVGILGLHKIQDRPVSIKGQVMVRPMMYVALSYDHRIVDGREAVQFVVTIKNYIEDPGHLLLES